MDAEEIIESCASEMAREGIIFPWRDKDTAFYLRMALGAGYDLRRSEVQQPVMKMRSPNGEILGVFPGVVEAANADLRNKDSIFRVLLHGHGRAGGGYYYKFISVKEYHAYINSL